MIEILSSCYRTPSLNGESIGSTAGGITGGLVAASQAGGNLIIIGAGGIFGSVLGGIIGEAFDDMDRVHEPNPALWPIVMDCYQTRRPLYISRYCPGISLPPENPMKYQDLTWVDYPTAF